VDALVYLVGGLIFVIGLYLVFSPWLRKSRRPRRRPPPRPDEPRRPTDENGG
jgi:hypothetical protein